MCLLITETVQLLLLTYVYVLVYLSVIQVAKTAKMRFRFHYYSKWCESVPKRNMTNSCDFVTHRGSDGVVCEAWPKEKQSLEGNFLHEDTNLA